MHTPFTQYSVLRLKKKKREKEKEERKFPSSLFSLFLSFTILSNSLISHHPYRKEEKEKL